VEVGWAGRKPRPGGEGGRLLSLGEGGGPREEEGEWAWNEGEVGPMEGRWGAGLLKAKAQVAGLKIGDGPKLKKEFFSNFN
jgi:hypothetical protein